MSDQALELGADQGRPGGLDWQTSVRSEDLDSSNPMEGIPAGSFPGGLNNIPGEVSPVLEVSGAVDPETVPLSQRDAMPVVSRSAPVPAVAASTVVASRPVIRVAEDSAALTEIGPAEVPDCFSVRELARIQDVDVQRRYVKRLLGMFGCRMSRFSNDVQAEILASIEYEMQLLIKGDDETAPGLEIIVRSLRLASQGIWGEKKIADIILAFVCSKAAFESLLETGAIGE